MTGLLNIPFETLQQVCELVAGARPSNLIPFSEVSKECLAASSQSLWRTIPLEITSRDQIPRRVHRLKHVLRTRLSRNARIRCISITSDQPLRDREDKESNISRLERAYLDNIAWQPLADVLAKIPPLSDMEWEKDELPPCILQPLNSRHHNCRLRIVKVKCAAIEDPDLHNRPTARPIFMYELLLPLQNDYILRRENISRRGAGNGSAGCFDLAIVGTLSASLTQLRYRDTYSSEHHRVQQIDSSEFELVSRQRIGPRARYKAATLSTLDLTSQKPLDKRQEIRRSGIVMWSTLTRLPALRTLKSSLVFHSDALEYLTAKGILGSLKTLDIVIHSRSKSQRPDILVGFLRSLPPLENLALAGEIHTARCEDWMSCHASSLKRLQLMPLKYCDGTFDLVSLSLILKPPLPLLEHLTITLKRSKGDLDEVDALVNKAVDEVLATAIFRTISAAKPDRSLPLERLEVIPSGDCGPGRSGDFGTRWSDIMQHIERSWLVKRMYPGLGSDELSVNRVRSRELDPPLVFSTSAKDMLRRVWHVRPGTKWDFQKDWHSFPLEQ